MGQNVRASDEMACAPKGTNEWKSFFFFFRFRSSIFLSFPFFLAHFLAPENLKRKPYAIRVYLSVFFFRRWVWSQKSQSRPPVCDNSENINFYLMCLSIDSRRWSWQISIQFIWDFFFLPSHAHSISSSRGSTSDDGRNEARRGDNKFINQSQSVSAADDDFEKNRNFFLSTPSNLFAGSNWNERNNTVRDSADCGLWWTEQIFDEIPHASSARNPHSTNMWTFTAIDIILVDWDLPGAEAKLFENANYSAALLQTPMSRVCKVNECWAIALDGVRCYVVTNLSTFTQLNAGHSFARYAHQGKHNGNWYDHHLSNM